jgi:predicted DNA-binding transcriptional regulator AlpA
MENSKKPSSKSDDQLLRIQDVAAITTLSKSCINLWVAQGRFPKPIALSKTVKLWSMGVLRQWMLDQQLIRGPSNV